MPVNAADIARAAALALVQDGKLFDTGRAGVVSQGLADFTGSASKTFREWCVETA